MGQNDNHKEIPSHFELNSDGHAKCQWPKLLKQLEKEQIKTKEWKRAKTNKIENK
jgi:hypothetical protein